MKPIEKNLEILLVALLGLIFAVSCSPVTIHDDTWCADAGKFGAECFNTISNKEFSLNKYEWDKLRVGQICSATERPGEGYKNIKVAIEKLCADSRFCTPEQKSAVKSIGEKVEKSLEKSSGNDPFSK